MTKSVLNLPSLHYSTIPTIQSSRRLSPSPEPTATAGEAPGIAASITKSIGPTTSSAATEAITL
jgi:hypothetical protein